MTSPALDWRPFEQGNAIGDPGRQPEIRAAAGPLNVGVNDTALDFLSIDAFEVRGCSTRGWSHRYNGTPRQDAYALLVNEDVLVVAIADGVSEGDFSQVAAETAARSSCKLVADQFAKNGAVDWVQLARRISMRIIEEGEYRQIAVPDEDEPTVDDRLRACLSKMSTTLIVAVVGRVPAPEGFPVELGVVAGDSAAYLLPAGSDVLVPAGGGKTGSGSITSTRVRPLPGPVEPEIVRLTLRPGDAIVLGSDGIGDPVGDGTGEVGREFAARWNSPPTIDSFLLDLNVYRRSYDDDRTAVGVWLRPDIELPDAPVTDDGAGETPEDDAIGDDTVVTGAPPADDLTALVDAVHEPGIEETVDETPPGSQAEREPAVAPEAPVAISDAEVSTQKPPEITDLQKEF